MCGSPNSFFVTDHAARLPRQRPLGPDRLISTRVENRHVHTPLFLPVVQRLLIVYRLIFSQPDLNPEYQYLGILLDQLDDRTAQKDGIR